VYQSKRVHLTDKSPCQVSKELDSVYIYVWNGNYYALAVTERLKLEDSSGMVRVGPVHYNTMEELERFGEAIRRIAQAWANRDFHPPQCELQVLTCVGVTLNTQDCASLARIPFGLNMLLSKIFRACTMFTENQNNLYHSP